MPYALQTPPTCNRWAATSPVPAAHPGTAAAATPRRGTCDHPIWGQPGGLTCIRQRGHEPGHVYQDRHGSDVDDRHTDGGHG